MNNDNPNIRQIEDLLAFCARYKHIYIYDCGEPQYLLSKFLKMCGINCSGLINDCESPEKLVLNQDKEFLQGSHTWWVFSDKISVLSWDELLHTLTDEKNSCGFLIISESSLYQRAYQKLRSLGFENFYVFSEFNRRALPYKMRPRSKDRFWVEFNVVDHCNLNCQFCDHYSQLADKSFLSLDSFTKDVKRLSDLMSKCCGIIKLQGGEPLLHPQLIDFIKITRQFFPTSVIFLFTNGLLLTKKENIPLWEAFRDYDVTLQVTTYPIAFNYEKVDDLANKYGIKYQRFSEVGDRDSKATKKSVRHPFSLKGDVTKSQFVSCYQFNESITLRDGKVYTCPVIAYVEYFNRRFNLELGGFNLQVQHPQS